MITFDVELRRFAHSAPVISRGSMAGTLLIGGLSLKDEVH
jgi:hypothetical protein